MLLMHLATERGLVTLQQDAESSWRIQARHLTGEDVNVIAHRPGHPATLFAGTYGQGLLRSTDHGQHWSKLSLPADYIRAIAFAPDSPTTVYVGTEPATFYASVDEGETWVDLGIERLPQSREWRLPYSPRRGALRCIGVHPRNPAWLYGAVEQGGVLRSPDRGATWTIHNDDVDPDVHWLAIHPEHPALIFAATGNGLFRSQDSGTSWQQLFDDYIRAVAIHPLMPRLVLAGPAGAVGEHGQILLSQDGGDTWQPAMAGLSTPLPDMIEHFVLHPALPGTAYAIRSGETVLQSSLDKIHWHPLVPALEKVQDLDLIAS